MYVSLSLSTCVPQSFFFSAFLSIIFLFYSPSFSFGGSLMCYFFVLCSIPLLPLSPPTSLLYNLLYKYIFSFFPSLSFFVNYVLLLCFICNIISFFSHFSCVESVFFFSFHVWVFLSSKIGQKLCKLTLCTCLEKKNLEYWNHFF